MIRALYTAASGMTAQQINVDSIAHNLANSSTTGFKMRRAQFQDLLYQNMVQPGTSAGQQTVVPTGLQVGLGTRTSSNEIIFTQGSFVQSANPLDLVIAGTGFFQVRRPAGDPAVGNPGGQEGLGSLLVEHHAIPGRQTEQIRHAPRALGSRGGSNPAIFAWSAPWKSQIPRPYVKP